MKRIVCTVTNDLTYDRRIQRICNSLARAGYEVMLVGRQLKNAQPFHSQLFKSFRLRCHFNKGKLFYLEYNLRLLYFLLRHPFDLVCAVDLDTLLPAWLASRLRGRICVYDAHEYFTEVPEVVRRPLIRRSWEVLARAIIPRLKYAYTVGPALAQALEERYGTRFAVIRNLPHYRPETGFTDKAHPPILLYQGALNEGRGLEAAIDAMPLMDEVELWLAGEGDLSTPLREQVAAAGLEERVRFMGFVLPADLPALTARATLGLNLLENSGLSYFYSLANKAFDYIQAGLPSLQMDFPEYRRLNEQYGVFELLPALSPEAVAAAVNTLLTDENRYRQLQSNCWQAARELNWEKEEEKLLAIYREALAGG